MSTVENFRNRGAVVDVFEDDAACAAPLDDLPAGAHSLGEDMMSSDSNSPNRGLRGGAAAVRRKLGDVPAFTLERIREDERLQREFAGRYVAYKDRWKLASGIRKLIRTVVADAASPWELEKAIDQLPEKKRLGIARRFVEKTDVVEERAQSDSRF